MAEKPMTQTAYAKRIGISQPRISRMVKDGIITIESMVRVGKTLKIYPTRADREIANNRDVRYVPRNVEGAKVPLKDQIEVAEKTGTKKIVELNKLRAIGEQYKTGLLKIKYEAEQGKWIWAEEAEKIVFAAALQFKETAKSMVERIAPLMAAEKSHFKIKKILMGEVNQMLKELSDSFAKVAGKGG